MLAVVVVVFAAVMLAMQGLYWYRVTQKQKESKALARRLGTAGGNDDRELLFRLDLKKKDPQSMSDVAGRIEASMEQLLVEAGDPFNFQQLVMQMVIAALVGMLALFLIARSPMALAGLMAAYVPVLLLKSKAQKRAARITEQLPDALELAARSLQAGHGIAEAMRSVAEEMDAPIAMEFGRVYEQNNLGRDFRECMEALVARNPTNFDLKIFASSVLLQRETGGNLIEILEGIAGTIRKRFVFRGKVKALTAEAKFSAIILGALPFFVTGAILAIRPEYMDPMKTDPLGKAMIMFICVWFTLGVFVMREITKIEV